MVQSTQTIINQQQQSQQQPLSPLSQQHQQQQQTHLQQQQVQQSQHPNSPAQQNNNYLPAHLTQTHGFSPLQQPPPSGGVYLHPPGSQPIGGAVYHMLSAASMPSSVYVHNVTANVNLHGYPVPSYIPGAGSPAFIAANEVQQNIPHMNEQVVRRNRFNVFIYNIFY